MEMVQQNQKKSRICLLLVTVCEWYEWASLLCYHIWLFEFLNEETVKWETVSVKGRFLRYFKCLLVNSVTNFHSSTLLLVADEWKTNLRLSSDSNEEMFNSFEL